MSNNQVFSYISNANYNYLIEIKSKLILDGYNNSSMSKIIELAIMQLKNKNEYIDVKKLLLENEMIK